MGSLGFCAVLGEISWINGFRFIPGGGSLLLCLLLHQLLRLVFDRYDAKNNWVSNCVLK